VTFERRVIKAEALAWMKDNVAAPDTSVVTSLPDVSELSLDVDTWKAWFIEASRAVLRWVPRSGVAIFYQSDIRRGRVWIDKGHLVMRAADEEGVDLLWHKIVCRSPPGTVTAGRPGYSHMLCFGAASTTRPSLPDVLAEAGPAPWTRGMGIAACELACTFLRAATTTRTVVDPFCGRGTVLAVANAMGFAALGIDVNARRCRAAKRLTLPR
jgi:hypothetical protein